MLIQVALLVAFHVQPVDVVTLTLLRNPAERTISVLKHFKRLYAPYRDLPLDAIYDDDIVYPHFVQDFQTCVFALERADHPRAFAGAAVVTNRGTPGATAAGTVSAPQIGTPTITIVKP